MYPFVYQQTGDKQEGGYTSAWILVSGNMYPGVNAALVNVIGDSA